MNSYQKKCLGIFIVTAGTIIVSCHIMGAALVGVVVVVSCIAAILIYEYVPMWIIVLVLIILASINASLQAAPFAPSAPVVVTRSAPPPAQHPAVYTQESFARVGYLKCPTPHGQGCKRMIEQEWGPDRYGDPEPWIEWMHRHAGPDAVFIGLQYIQQQHTDRAVLYYGVRK